MPSLAATNAKLISLVIPCCNEEDVLPLLYDRIQQAVKEWPYQVEVILIDDGSTDRTWEQMEHFHDGITLGMLQTGPQGKLMTEVTR